MSQNQKTGMPSLADSRIDLAAYRAAVIRFSCVSFAKLVLCASFAKLTVSLV